MRTPPTGRTLLDSLARRGLIACDDLNRAEAAVHAAPDKPAHFTLLEKGFIEEEPLSACPAARVGYP